MTTRQELQAKLAMLDAAGLEAVAAFEKALSRRVEPRKFF